MYSNWALSVRVRGALTPLLRGLQAVAQLPEEAAHGRVELTRHPRCVSAAASFERLLHVHRSGDVGSPRVRGSTSASRAAVMPGCVVWMRGRPAPGRRRRSAGATPRTISSRPFRIVSRARPVADDTTASPPYPMASDSVAAHTRRPRSFSSGDTMTNFATRVASSSMSRCTRT